MNEAREIDAVNRSIRVRVWFGRFPIVDYTTSPEAACAQARGLGRRFSGLRVTMDPGETSLSWRPARSVSPRRGGLVEAPMPTHALVGFLEGQVSSPDGRGIVT